MCAICIVPFKSSKDPGPAEERQLFRTHFWLAKLGLCCRICTIAPLRTAKNTAKGGRQLELPQRGCRCRLGGNYYLEHRAHQRLSGWQFYNVSQPPSVLGSQVAQPGEECLGGTGRLVREWLIGYVKRTAYRSLNTFISQPRQPHRFHCAGLQIMH